MRFQKRWDACQKPGTWYFSHLWSQMSGNAIEHVAMLTQPKAQTHPRILNTTIQSSLEALHLVMLMMFTCCTGDFMLFHWDS